MTSKVKPNEGDWICQSKNASGTSCGNVNFSTRSKCNKCNAEMQKEWLYKKTGIEIGKQQADKSGGLFNADDWMCKSCGNINWARRMKCNVCNTSKIAKAESRTGLGGGYKDRDDVVEYKERAESDDEFDEFGLKKKKFRGQAPGGAAAGDNDNEQSKNADDNENEKEASGDRVEPAHESAESAGHSEGEEEEEEEEDEGDLDKYNLLDEDDVEDLVVEKKKMKPSRERSKRDDSSGDSSSSSSSGGESSGEDSKGSSSSGSSTSSEDESSDGKPSDSESTSSASSRDSDKRRRHAPREDRHRQERNRSRSRSPIDKNGRKEKHQSRR